MRGGTYNLAFVDVAGFVEEGVHCVWSVEGYVGIALSFCWTVGVERVYGEAVPV